METKFPITSVDSFKGRKIRAASSLASVVQALGAQQVALPLGEVYTALQTGILDGTLLSMLNLSDFKIMDVVSHVLETPAILTVTESDIRVNKAAWNALPGDLRAAFVKAAREVNLQTYVPYMRETRARHGRPR